MAAGFGVAGLAMAAAGVAGLLNVIRGGPGMSIFALVGAALCLGLAGYFAWGYSWLQKHPKELKNAEARANLLKPPE